jgi:hypothetical protein
MFGIGIGVGIGRQRFASGIFSAYAARVAADGGTTEAGECVDAVSALLQTASLLLVPSGFKSGKVYSQIPTNGNGDLTFTRASDATRVNSDGEIELMATGVPRLSYMYGSCPALLLEPQRTNLLTWSDDFSNAAWSKNRIVVTANAVTSPDGTQNADKIADTLNGNNTYRIFNSTTLSAISYTQTFYAKAAEYNWCYVRIGNASRAWFNVGTGVVGTVDSGLTASIQSVGNGWYRIITTITTATAGGGFGLIALTTSNGLEAYTPTTGGMGIYVWGAQLEAGAYPTTYIPTTTASATRVADSFSRNNIFTNGLITSSGGTWFVELRGNVAYRGDGAGDGIFLRATGDTDNFRFYSDNSATTRVIIFKRVSNVNTQIYTTTTDTTKIAIKWNGTTADIFANGTKVVSATSFTATQLQEFATSITGAPKFIQAMALYPSPLSDTDCTTLTTL